MKRVPQFFFSSLLVKSYRCLPVPYHGENDLPVLCPSMTNQGLWWGLLADNVSRTLLVNSTNRKLSSSTDFPCYDKKNHCVEGGKEQWLAFLLAVLHLSKLLFNCLPSHEGDRHRVSGATCFFLILSLYQYFCRPFPSSQLALMVILCFLRSF